MNTIVRLADRRIAKAAAAPASSITLAGYPDSVFVDQGSSSGESLYDHWQRLRLRFTDEWALELILENMRDLRMNSELKCGEPHEFYILEQDLTGGRGFAFLLPRVLATRPHRTVYFFARGMVIDKPQGVGRLVKRLHSAMLD